MLNEDLFTPEELEIKRLQLQLAKKQKTIDAFKEYDKERKGYYAKSMIELGQLKSYVEEMEETNSIIPTINKLRKEVTHYQQLYENSEVSRGAQSKIKALETKVNMLHEYAEMLREQLKRNNITPVNIPEPLLECWLRLAQHNWVRGSKVENP